MRTYALFLALTAFTFFSCQRDNDRHKAKIADKPATGNASVDVCVYSANSAGIIAGYSAKKLGKSVIVISPEKHVGGLTAGGLGSTDIGNKFAIIGLARRFYRQIGEHYGNFENWTFEPHVAEELYQSYIKEENIDVRYQWRLKKVNKDGAKITSIILENALNTSETMEVGAKIFIDCSYVGDLMGNSGVSFTVGREPNDTYDEDYNGVQLRKKHQFEDGIDPYIVEGDSTSGLLWGINPEPIQADGTGDKKIQAYNFRLCLTQRKENFIPIEKPGSYDRTKYALLSRLMNKRVENEKERHGIEESYLIINKMPNGKTDINNKGAFSTDYIGGNINYATASYDERAQMWQEHKDYLQGLLYFMGHDKDVPQFLKDEMLTWGFCKDEFKDENGFSHQMYVREGRRMIGELVMTQHHCVGDEVVHDPIGLAAYTMDSHNCDRHIVKKEFEGEPMNMVKAEGNVEVGGFPPYPIGYGSLVPHREECTNLIVPVAMSASHIA